MTRKKYKKVMLLGLDGLDPKILFPMMNRGDLPNFKKLSLLGANSSLATSIPAQSPVAWASIATGNNPGYHGIYDFLDRRVSDYMPELAILKMNPKNFLGKRESMFLTVMQGETLWDYTSAQDIPSTVIRWPSTFQPKQNKAKLYSGLGVPDLKGGLGRYTFYTSKNVPRSEEGAEKVVKVSMNGQQIETFIFGPRIGKVASREEAKTKAFVKIENGASVEIQIGGRSVRVRKGQWSDWLEVTFKIGLVKTVTGTVKFYLSNINPEFELYMTSIQINPKNPAFVISNPDSYISELAGDLGSFYTLGLSEDTKALEEGRIDEDAFISMCEEIIGEQEKMLWHELDRFQEGLLAFAFFTTDRIQHIFWVTKDPQHPLYNQQYAEKYGHIIDDYYRRADRILGRVLDTIDDETALMTFSDHGFSTFRRTVHINRWLVEKGFMKLTRKVEKEDKEGGGLFQYVDWSRTRAYALGFGSVYLNIKGREKQGILQPGTEAEAIMEKISEGLKGLNDPEEDRKAVRNVYTCSDIYTENKMSKSPDLVIGFQDGYRASWQTAIGGTPYHIFEDNLKKWSGDHIVDPSLVPGIFFSNFKVGNYKPHQMDIAPTVLSCFGMPVSGMDGTSLV
jgi:predicted AlkP superfamily phosphohydrolase/phosphomutase